MRTNKSDLDRFYEKLIPEPNSGCWIWIGAITKLNYTSFRFRHKTALAHRASYILHKGEIPSNKEIDHLCRMRCCVNPEHLELVTRSENIKRSPLTLPNLRAAQTHCIHGHAFDEINTYHNPAGKRACRICQRDRMRGYRAARPVC